MTVASRSSGETLRWAWGRAFDYEVRVVSEADGKVLASKRYPGDRYVCFGGIADSVKDVAAAYGEDVVPPGHAVVKVAPDGDTFRVFVLDTADESMRVIYERGFFSRSGDKRGG